MFDESVFGDEPFLDPMAGDPLFGDSVFADRTPGTSPLAAVAEQFGRRLPELAFEPGLVAAIDQHAAAIRDAVYTYADSDTSLHDVLTDYVLGFTDALREMGWQADEGYDFATLRLTAVCYFMRAYGVGTTE